MRKILTGILLLCMCDSADARRYRYHHHRHHTVKRVKHVKQAEWPRFTRDLSDVRITGTMVLDTYSGRQPTTYDRNLATEWIP